MSERLRSVSFQDFRGLPAFSYDLKGRHLVILGGNGKGKTAVVDGIEFAFRGFLSRFRGEGTGTINDQEALRHLKASESPSAGLHFQPSNETVLRMAGSEDPLQAKNQRLAAFLHAHPPVDSFILRRSQLLRFISAQDAKRYEMFVDLLGLNDLSSTQQAFNSAAEESQGSVEDLEAELKTILTQFTEHDPPYQPASTEVIRERLSQRAHSLGGKALPKWEDLAEVLNSLTALRSAEHAKEIELLTKAVLGFEQNLPEGMDQSIGDFNRSFKKARKLRAQSEEAKRSAVITAGAKYFDENPTDQECPLCERTLDQDTAAFQARLSSRLENLSEYQTAISEGLAALKGIRRLGNTLEDLVAREKRHDPEVSKELKERLDTIREEILRWTSALPEVDPGTWQRKIEEMPSLAILVKVRKEAKVHCEGKKKALIPESEAALEATIESCQRAKNVVSRLEHLNSDLACQRATAVLASLAKAGFTKAREQAVQTVFDQIATTVLTYYRILHDVEGIEEAECRRVTLAATSRAAAGGLKLAVDFLSNQQVDPRAYLSEGHLDSLGLCIYLATVKTFNSPGSLLVLDDVLTSIDKDHRHRLRDLLLSEFDQFQLIITTHDEFWVDQIREAVIARGEGNRWRFLRFVNWTLDGGPETAELDVTRDFIHDNLTDPKYRELGGALRLVTEDFLKRLAEGMKLKVTYRRDGRHTVGDFNTSGVVNDLRRALIKADPAEESQIKIELSHVFGTQLINALSHEGDRRMDVPLPEVRDYVSALESIIERAATGRLLKGVSP